MSVDCRTRLMKSVRALRTEEVLDEVLGAQEVQRRAQRAVHDDHVVGGGRAPERREAAAADLARDRTSGHQHLDTRDELGARVDGARGQSQRGPPGRREA